MKFISNNNYMKEKIIAFLMVFVSKRFKTFYWNSFYMAIAGFIDIVLQNIADFNLPVVATAILGMALAQISKAIRNKIVEG